MKLISVVVPVLNEESIISELLLRLNAVFQNGAHDYEFIFIDDGSTDHTLEMLKQYQKDAPQIHVISFSKNFGHQSSITAGMAHARGDAVIIMDGDLQDPPEFIPTLIEYWNQGYDVVHARRSKRKGENWFKLITARLFYRVFNMMTEIQMPLDTGDFRLIDKKVVTVYNTISEKNPFIRGLIAWIGFRQIQVEYVRDERFAGKTKFSLIKMLTFAMDGIISFSNKPLRVAITLGILVTLCAFLLIAYFLYLKLFHQGVFLQGWLSTVVLILFLSGVQLITIGIMGEYVARIYTEVKNRPRYVVNAQPGEL